MAATKAFLKSLRKKYGLGEFRRKGTAKRSKKARATSTPPAKKKRAISRPEAFGM